MEEIWKKISGYEDSYEISTYGNIRNIKTCKFLSPSKSGRYVSVTLYKNGNRCTHSVHRLIAINFIDNPCGKEYVNHIDGNKHNNKVGNLEWVTASENSIHAVKNGLYDTCPCGKIGKDNINSKLGEHDIFIIRSLYTLMDMKEIATMYDISHQNVSCIVRNVTWKHVELV
jgi:uncharacterized Fe-S cluster protein YjdI